ncbi:MAG: leucine-rich repeat protein [bacterium]|nr:leucine-rich repeat protein [bacterium]
MKRKIITVLTALFAITAAALPVITDMPERVYAAAANSNDEKDSNNDGVTDNGFVYTVNAGNTATITGYRGTATALTIPLTIADSGTNKYDVTEIASYAFAGNAGLTSVTTQGGGTTTGTGSNTQTPPAGMQRIGAMAFFGCPSLSTVTISATVTSIENQAFSDCPALTAINVTAGNRRYISNDGVLYEYVGYNQGAVGNYNTYTLLQYPSGKVSNAYTAPTTIANRLTVIGKGAFAGAQSLATINLPEAVEQIDASAFQNCSALTTISIPTKVTQIASHTFSGCSSLESVVIPDTVKSIGEYAFQNCYALSSVKFPQDIVTIASGCFYGCSALSEVTIPNKVTSIGASSFAYCSGLVKITIPASVTSIGSNAFLGVNGLTIYCHSGSQAASYASSNRIGSVMTYTVRFLSDTGNLISSQEIVYGSGATAPSMPERPGYKLTWSSAFDNVTSDLSVNAIWTRVYKVTFVDKYNNKTVTKEVEAGKNATAPSWSMSGYTLVWDKSLSNVLSDRTINASWRDPATGFVVNGDTKKPAKKSSTLTKGYATYKVTSADVQNPKVRFVGYTNTEATSISIPATVTISGVKYKVTSIGSSALKGRTKLTSVTIGSNVAAIGSNAFYKCKNLAKITVKSKSISRVGSKAFYGIKNRATIYAYRSKLTTYQKLIKNSKINTTIQLKAIS